MVDNPEFLLHNHGMSTKSPATTDEIIQQCRDLAAQAAALAETVRLLAEENAVLWRRITSIDTRPVVRLTCANANCGNEFVPARANQNCCSKKCAESTRQQRHRERERAAQATTSAASKPA
jgi:hypothetical protein